MRGRRERLALAALFAALPLAAAPLAAAAQESTAPVATQDAATPQATTPQATTPEAATPQTAAPPVTTPSAAAARADQVMYVVEQLVVNVYGAPAGGAGRVATLKSGDRVDVIERTGDEVHVRLASGRDGWVRASYLTAAEPLRLQLAARSAEVTRLQADVTRLEGELHSAQTAPARSATVPTAGGAGGQMHGPLLDAGPVIYRPRWRWVALSALVSLGIGFALGWWMLDRRIRTKYGGLRIY